jgi:hypothetical protein
MSNGNGNGTDLYDSAPISKWIRPCVAIAGALEGFALLVYDAIYAIASPEPSLAIIAIVGAIAGVGLGYAGWYFGIRSQDKGISTLKSTITELANVVKTQNGTPPKADNGQSAGEGDLPVEPEPVEPEPIEPSQYEPFDEATFDAELEADTEGIYSVKNAATKFYLAWDRGRRRFDPQNSDWASYIRKLVNLYFSEIWGLKDASGNLISESAVAFAEAHLNDEKGCTTCAGAKSCIWTSLQQKADYMGKTSYAYALQWVQSVENYLG